jgi:TolB-like protein/Flp pilus assembly protein TadD
MAQDNDNQSAPQRGKILEEIRRRAEEAEMKRLEEEDQQEEHLGVPEEDAGLAAPPPTPFPVPEMPGPADSGQAAREQRVVILVERIQIALDRGRLEKAKELVAELGSLAPGDSQVTVFRARIEGMEEAARRAREKKAAEEKAAAAKAASLKAAAEKAAAEKAAANKAAAEKAAANKAAAEKAAAEKAAADRAAAERAGVEKAAADAAAKATMAQKPAEQKPPSVRLTESSRSPRPEPPKADPAREREERAARRKKLNAILTQANALYQQEKYDAATQVLQGVFDLEPEHEEALQLREQIEKSKQFADKIRQEEARHKAEQTAQREATPRPEPPPKPAESDKDFWGTKSAPQPDLPFELAPQEKGPVGPPKPPLMDRMVERVSRIHIPVKPILIGGGAIVLTILIYMAVSNLVTAVVPPKPSLLVLPALADPLDSTLAATADGFVEALIRDLSHVPELRIVNPVSAFAVRRSNATPGALARTMGTSYILQSSMGRLGEKFVLTATFLDTATGKIRWTGKQTFSALDAPAARMELVSNLLRTLEVAVPPTLQPEMRKRPTSSDAAYEAYQRGLTMERHPETFPAGVSMSAFAQALVADSLYPEAQVALGKVLMRSFEFDKNAPRGYATRALFCVQKAMSSGLRSSDVFVVWGQVELSRNQYAKAEERFRAAVEVAPSDAAAQRRLALVLAGRGSVDEAVAAARHAATDDPYNSEAWLTLGMVQQAREVFKPEGKDNLRAALRSYEQGYRVARDRSEFASGPYSDVLVYLDRHEQAIDFLIDHIARNKDDPWAFYRLGRAQQAAGKPVAEWQNTFGRARDLLRNAGPASAEDPTNYALLALVHTRVGAFKEAAVALARAQKIAPDDPDVLYAAARMYSLQRNKEQALAFMTKALERRYALERVLDMDFYNLWSDEQFVEAVRR